MQTFSRIVQFGMCLALAASAAGQGVGSYTPHRFTRGYDVWVNSQCNIFGAGTGTTPDPGGGGGGVPPVEIWIPPADNRIVLFTSVTGTVTWGDPNQYRDADGNDTSFTTDLESYGGISGLIHTRKCMFLVGVFLGPGGPLLGAPPRLDVTEAESKEVYRPLLGQTFFIGDGIADNVPKTQVVRVPDGAAYLYLGIADGAAFHGKPGWYNDNRGFIHANLRVLGTESDLFIVDYRPGKWGQYPGSIKLWHDAIPTNPANDAIVVWHGDGTGQSRWPYSRYPFSIGRPHFVSSQEPPGVTPGIVGFESLTVLPHASPRPGSFQATIYDPTRGDWHFSNPYPGGW